MAQCLDIFPLYGREPEAVENIRKGFQLVLADYPIEKITDAFRYHLKIYKEFPVPSDLVNIIERGGKPPFERSVYIAISKKVMEHRTNEEWQYMKDYERFMMTGNY